MKSEELICQVCGGVKTTQQSGRIVCHQCRQSKARQKRLRIRAVSMACVKCGVPKTTRTDGALICRPCQARTTQRVAAEGSADADSIAAIRLSVQHLGVSMAASALEIFDALCDVQNIVMTVPRMNPNAGRLRAGESLYPRREVAI